MTAPQERTLVLIKPGGIKRGLVGTIIHRFENKGLKLVALKQVWPPEQRFRQHYCDLVSRSYYPALVKYMCSSPVVPMVWEGTNAMKTVRAMIGAATCPTEKPDDPAPGTIRGDFCTQTGHGTVIHASDSIEAAKREIALWFNEDELFSWTSNTENGFYE